MGNHKAEPDGNYHPLAYFPELPPKPKRDLLRRFSSRFRKARHGFARDIKNASQQQWSARTTSDARELFEIVAGTLPRSIIDDFCFEDGDLRVCTRREFIEAFRFSFTPKPHRSNPLKARWDALGTVGLYDALPRDIIRLRVEATKDTPVSHLASGWKNAIDIIGHEMGHYVDSCCRKISIQPAFLEIFEAERHVMDSYCASDPQEFFAEAFWTCCAYPQLAETYIPETKAWFDRFLAYA